MSSRARTTDGKLYEGNQMFQGNGLQRSCMRCARHKPPTGGRKTRIGWVCRDCLERSK